MKLLCFSVDRQTHLGLKLEGGVLDLTAAGYARDLEATIRDYATAGREIEALGKKKPLPLLDEKALAYLPPATAGSKVICVGLNYKLHIEEASKGLSANYPKEPILFSKFHNALNGHHCPVSLSPNAAQYDYEAELAVIMGKGGMDIPEEKAAGYVFGYTCGNDVSARDAQNKSAQWLIGKSFPGFAPIGPWIVTTDELADPRRLAITCRRGAQMVQSSNTDQMIFDVYTIISYASRFIRIEPGDVILTGTPSGVILGMPPGEQNWLKAGDEVTVSIEGIGDLTNRFV